MIASAAVISGCAVVPIPKNRLSATNAAFGDGGIHTQWPKIIAKLFIGPLSHRGLGSARTAPLVSIEAQGPLRFEAPLSCYCYLLDFSPTSSLFPSSSLFRELRAHRRAGLG